MRVELKKCPVCERKVEKNKEVSWFFCRKCNLVFDPVSETCQINKPDGEAGSPFVGTYAVEFVVYDNNLVKKVIDAKKKEESEE